MSNHTEALKNLTGRLESRLKSSGRAGVYHPGYRILSDIRKLTSAAEALDGLRANRRPKETEEEHIFKVSRAAQKVQDDAAKIQDNISATFTEAMKDRINEADKLAGLTPGKFDAEIRATFRGMSGEERTKVLNEALKNGDSEFLSAVCLAPVLLSGLHSKDEQHQYIDALRKQKAPDLMQDIEDLQEALTTATAAGQVTNTMVKEAYDAEELARLEKAEAGADAAQAALSVH